MTEVAVGALVAVRSCYVGEEQVFRGRHRVLAVRDDASRPYVCLEGYDGYPFVDNVRLVGEDDAQGS